MSTSHIKRKNFICNLLISIIVLVVPIIVRLKLIPLSGSSYDFWKGDTTHADFFSYYKSIWLLALSLICIIAFIIYIYIKQVNFKLTYMYIPLGVYLVFTLLSTSYSEYKNTSLHGFTDRYEGLLIILSYIAICLIASYTISSPKDVKLVFSFMLTAALIISLIGISQFFSHDFFQTSIGKQLISPSISNLTFKFPDKYIYSTLYNPNYVGSYFSMLVPICLSLFLLSEKLRWKFVFGFLGAISLFSLIGSRSSTGILATIISCFILLIFLRRRILKYWIFCSLLVVCLIGSSAYIDSKYDHIITNEFKNITSELIPSNVDNQSTFTPGVLSDIDIKNNTTTLFFGNESLNITFDPKGSQFLFEDSQGVATASVQSEADPTLFTFSDARYAGVSLKMDNELITIATANSRFSLYITPDAGFKCISAAGKIVDFDTPDHYGFERYEHWGSYRGYIWSRTLPLLRDTLLLGHGPDTYAIYFPQADIAGKLKHMNDINILVDKPHNIYLQMAMNTGVISMLAFLAFVLIYIAKCFKLYFLRPYNNMYYKFGVTCMFAVIGFCISGIANDSVVSVSPVFWVLLGVGIACNKLYKQEIVIKLNPKVNKRLKSKEVVKTTVV